MLLSPRLMPPALPSSFRHIWAAGGWILGVESQRMRRAILTSPEQPAPRTSPRSTIFNRPVDSRTVSLRSSRQRVHSFIRHFFPPAAEPSLVPSPPMLQAMHMLPEVPEIRV